MDERLFYTLIKYDHELGDNKYVRGRISGIQLALCEKNSEDELIFSNMRVDKGIVLRVITTQDNYDKFTKLIEKLYPRLCTFDYMRDEK